MIKEIKEYLSSHKIVTPKLMAKDLSMDKDQIIMIMELLQVKSIPSLNSPCSLGLCSLKDKMNCNTKCE